MNGEKYVDLPFIHLNHYENASSCSLNKHILPEHGKTCTLWINTENFKNGKVATRENIVLKSCSILDFHSEYYVPEIEKLDYHLPHVYILGGNDCEGKCHDIFVSRNSKFYCKCTHNYV